MSGRHLLNFWQPARPKLRFFSHPNTHVIGYVSEYGLPVCNFTTGFIECSCTSGCIYNKTMYSHRQITDTHFFQSFYRKLDKIGCLPHCLTTVTSSEAKENSAHASFYFTTINHWWHAHFGLLLSALNIISKYLHYCRDVGHLVRMSIPVTPKQQLSAYTIPHNNLPCTTCWSGCSQRLRNLTYTNKIIVVTLIE